MEELTQEQASVLETAKRLAKEKEELAKIATKEQVQEYERRKQEEDRRLYARAHQIRAFVLSGDPKFYEIGKEELDILAKYFPEDAKKMQEKLAKAKEQDKKKPGSVDRTNLLMEIEGLAKKAFMVMMENLKMDKKKQMENQASKPAKPQGVTPKMQSEVENEKEPVKEKTTQKEPETKYVLREKQDGLVGGTIKDVTENLEDGYEEGLTGKKVERSNEREFEVVEVPTKKQQKLLDREQKREQKKAKTEKVSSVSLDEINKAKQEMNSSSNQGQGLSQEEIERRLKMYNQKTHEKAEKNMSQRQNEQSNDMQMMPRSFKKN